MWSEVIFQHPALGGGRILIEPRVLETLAPFRQMTTNAPEAGGVLLGYRRGPHLHVVAATTPKRNDRRGRFSFDRRDNAHQRAALRFWLKSDATIDYLGEWHTHPEPRPTPSPLDMEQWSKIFHANTYPMLFVIIGNKEEFWIGVASQRLPNEPTRCSLEVAE